jgi:hypothetical protein
MMDIMAMMLFGDRQERELLLYNPAKPQTINTDGEMSTGPANAGPAYLSAIPETPVHF